MDNRAESQLSEDLSDAVVRVRQIFDHGAHAEKEEHADATKQIH